MSKVELTVRQIMNLDLWDRVCEYKGWNPYILNEGLITEDEIVEFDDKFEKREEETVLFTEEELKDIEDKLYMMKDDELLSVTEKLIKSLMQYEKRIKRLSDEWADYVYFHGQDGHDAYIIMGVIDDIKGGKKFE